MHKAERTHPIISTRLVILAVLGFLFILAISLFAATREFNRYCLEVQRGNPSQIYFRGQGDELGGFTNCIINTPTLNPFILLLGAYIVLFVLHVYLISQLGQRKIVKNLVNVFIFAILLLSFSYLLGSFFQHIWHGFLEGGTWLEHGGWQLISFFTPWSQPRQPLYVYSQFLLLVFPCFFISQSGPMIITFLLNKFRLSYGYKPGIKSFLYILGGAALFQLLIMAILFILLPLARGIFYSPSPQGVVKSKSSFVQGTPSITKECSVVIKLCDKQGYPYRQKKARILKGVELVSTSQTDQRGTLYLKLAPGEYNLEIELGNNNFTNKGFNVKENSQVVNLVF